MKITDVRTTILRLPEVKPVGDGIQDLLVVEVDTDAGITGIGEVHTSPYVAEAIINAPLSHYSARGLKSIIIGENPLDREIIWQKMYRLTAVYGRRGVAIQAISGIDIALWDIFGKHTGLPIYQLLGGRYHARIKPYASLLMPDTPEEAQTEVQKRLAEGFKAVKLGWGPLGKNIKDDVKLVAAIRESAGEDVDLMLDIGFGMPFNRLVRLVKALEPFNLYFIEEPLSPDDLDGYTRLKEKTIIPVATGEKETTYYGFRELIRHGVDIIQPDIARAGGFTECKKIADLADKEGVLCIPHCWSSNILFSATLHLAACIAGIPYVEFCTVQTPLRTSLTKQRLTMEDGYVQVPQTPGLGIELDREVMAAFRYKPDQG